MRAVRGTDAVHARAGLHVVVAIGQTQPALQQIRHGVRRVVEVLRDPDPEQAIGIEVGAVQRVDVGTQRAADVRRQRVGIADCRDRRQLIAERREPPLFDPRLVHVAGVVIANLPLLGAVGRSDGGLEQLVRPLPRPIDEDDADAEAAAIGGDLVLLQPAAVRVAEEIVAGGDGRVHARPVDVVRGRRRGCARRRGRLGAAIVAAGDCQRERGGERDANKDGHHALDDTQLARGRRRRRKSGGGDFPPLRRRPSGIGSA
jgi:hypothetical protein